MKTIWQIREMDIEDLKDELTELGDRIKYDYSNSKDLKYLENYKTNLIIEYENTRKNIKKVLWHKQRAILVMYPKIHG